MSADSKNEGPHDSSLKVNAKYKVVNVVAHTESEWSGLRVPSLTYESSISSLTYATSERRIKLVTKWTDTCKEPDAIFTLSQTGADVNTSCTLINICSDIQI